jgi:hypothetical protein
MAIEPVPSMDLEVLGQMVRSGESLFTNCAPEKISKKKITENS